MLIKDVEMGSEWDLRICGTELCYPIGINLVVSGPTMHLHLVCELGRPCWGIDPKMQNVLRGRGMNLIDDKIGLIRTQDWSKCGDGVHPLYTLSFGQLFTDPIKAGFGGFYSICYCLNDLKDCADARNYTSSVGTLQMNGPNQLHHASCVLGDPCVVDIAPGTGLNHTNTVILRKTSNMNLDDRTGCDAPEVGSVTEIDRLNVNKDLHSYGLEVRKRVRYEKFLTTAGAEIKNHPHAFAKYDLGVPNHQVIYSKYNVPPPFSKEAGKKAIITAGVNFDRFVETPNLLPSSAGSEVKKKKKVDKMDALKPAKADHAYIPMFQEKT